MTAAEDADVSPSAKTRFVRSLIGKAEETRDLVRTVRDGDDEGSALLVHLEALHASARIFRVSPLAKVVAAQLDAADPTSAEWLADVEALSWRYLSLAHRSSDSGTYPATAEDTDAPDDGTWTLAQLVDRVVDEIRRGLVDGADGDPFEPLGAGIETRFLAPVWSTISRLQTLIEEQSDGRVRFEDSLGVPLLTITGAPAPMPASDDDASRLDGRTVLIADDDPTIRWFYVGLLREAGADVIEAEDGVAALDLARRARPDVVLADILMPRLDGLALAKALQREPLLSHVPLILLSWREDFLQRMRDLNAGAQGYLRKELPRDQVLERVTQLLKPVRAFEEALREQTEMRTELEGVGVMQALQLVAEHRSHAQVLIQDAWNIFDLVVADGRLASATCTGVDGAPVVGRDALRRLAGLDAGRIVVSSTRDTPPPGDADLFPDLLDEAWRLSAVVECIIDRPGVSLRLDPDVFTTYLRHSPESVQEVAQQLALGKPIDALSHLASPHTVQGVALGLVRLGAVHMVATPDGDDAVHDVLVGRGDGDVQPTITEAGTVAWATGPVAAQPEPEAVAEKPTQAEGESTSDESAPQTAPRVERRRSYTAREPHDSSAEPKPESTPPTETDAESFARRENARAGAMIAMHGAPTNRAPRILDSQNVRPVFGDVVRRPPRRYATAPGPFTLVFVLALLSTTAWLSYGVWAEFVDPGESRVLPDSVSR